MKKTLVTNFPIGLRSEETKIGLYVLPVVAEQIAKIMKTDFTLAINTLDSYRDRERFKDGYIKDLNSVNIIPDSIWHDLDHSDINLKLSILEKAGYLKEKVATITTCNCGKVEIEKDKTLNKNAKLFTNGQCNECQSDLYDLKSKILIVQFPSEPISNINAFPQNYIRDVQNHFNKISGMEYLISRKRHTGIEYKYNGSMYNIDIDLCWILMLSDLKADEIILCGTEHVVWHMSLMVAFQNILENHKHSAAVYFVFVPYVYENKSEFPIKSFIDELFENEMLLKGFILMNLSWKKRRSNWSKSIYIFLHKHKSQLKNLENHPKIITEVNQSLLELSRKKIEERLISSE